MNYAELIAAVAAKQNITKKDTKAIVDAVFATIGEGMKETGKVKVSGFGSFINQQVEQREYRNPQTGEPIPVPAHGTPKFKPAAALKKLVK